MCLDRCNCAWHCTASHHIGVTGECIHFGIKIWNSYLNPKAKTQKYVFFWKDLGTTRDGHKLENCCLGFSSQARWSPNQVRKNQTLLEKSDPEISGLGSFSNSSGVAWKRSKCVTSGQCLAFAMILLTLPGSDICMLRCTYITSRCPWCCQCYLELQKLELELGASSRVLRGTQEGKLTSQGSQVRKCQSPAWMLAQCLVCLHHRNHGQKTLARHLWTRIWKIQICILTSMEFARLTLGQLHILSLSCFIRVVVKIKWKGRESCKPVWVLTATPTNRESTVLTKIMQRTALLVK